LEDGLKLRVLGYPKLHPQYGFSVSFEQIQPVGEGSIKKASDLLRTKLEAEGLFAAERKRSLPEIPVRIGLITAAASAAAVDFIKILNERWGGVEILLVDVLVQGQDAPAAIVAALKHFEQASPLIDVLVITRGGGSAEDLAAFNDERVVRAVAGSRTPTLVAIGHEVDISLAELAADVRASTPTNAAQLVVPDRTHIIGQLHQQQISLHKNLISDIKFAIDVLQDNQKSLTSQAFLLLDQARQNLASIAKLITVFDPAAALKRGYAIVQKGKRNITSVKQVKTGDKLLLHLADGKIKSIAE
jgi:exodeoxyribonuclease VII large subunit